MARRAPDGEKPFRPLDASVLQSVLQHRPQGREPILPSPQQSSSNLIELSQPVANKTAWREPTEAKPRMMVPEVQRFDQEKRILFTRAEAQALDRLVSNLAVRLRTQVKTSHVLRALTSLLLHAENHLDHHAMEAVVLTRPPNGDLAALQHFERAIANLLAQAMRDAGVPR